VPQTVEALDHAKAANVPIIVAVNKIDKDDADPNRVRTQMVERGVVPSEWGGDYEFVDVSAKANLNLDALLDTILVVADLEELKGDPTGRARGTVLEAHLDRGRGPVATVLVQKGTLSVGRALIGGTAYCRIRAMQDENGREVTSAGPYKPVPTLGCVDVPDVCDDAPGNEGVEIRTYNGIYDAIDDIKAAFSHLLKPEEREEILGEAEVRQMCRVPKLGVIAGSYIRSGTIPRNASVRLVRDGVIVY